jgi:hypothetical protein
MVSQETDLYSGGIVFECILVHVASWCSGNMLDVYSTIFLPQSTLCNLCTWNTAVKSTPVLVI